MMHELPCLLCRGLMMLDRFSVSISRWSFVTLFYRVFLMLVFCEMWNVTLVEPVVDLLGVVGLVVSPVWIRMFLTETDSCFSGCLFV